MRQKQEPGTGRWFVAAVLICGLAIASPARAATEVGQVSPDEPDVECSGGSWNLVQLLVNSGNSYVVPGPGVITRWRTRSRAFFPAGTARLLLWRRVTATTFTLAARSDPETTVPGQVSEYPTRIPVSGGEIVGLRAVDVFGCGFSEGPSQVRFDPPPAPDPAPGETHELPDSNGATRINALAVLEPDADGDGFGDETQDPCPGEPGAETGCPILDTPETAITAGPKDKTRRKTATFRFTSSQPTATFECRLDGGAFAPCVSPHTVRVKRGRHAFAVRASANGQQDASPAADDWKVKKKRRKKKK